MNGWGNKSNWYSGFFDPSQVGRWQPSFPMTIPGQRAEPYAFAPRGRTLFPTVEPRPQWKATRPTVTEPTEVAPTVAPTVAPPTPTVTEPTPTVAEPTTPGLFDIVSWEEWYERHGVIAYGISLEEYVRTAREFMDWKFKNYGGMQLSAEEMVQMRMDFFGPRGLDWRLWSRILGLGGWNNPEPGDPRYNEQGMLV